MVNIACAFDSGRMEVALTPPECDEAWTLKISEFIQVRGVGFSVNEFRFWMTRDQLIDLVNEIDSAIEKFDSGEGEQDE